MAVRAAVVEGCGLDNNTFIVHLQLVCLGRMPTGCCSYNLLLSK